MRHDYVNFGFDQADTVIAVGYELQEFDPRRINPNSDKRIIHIHRFPAEVDVHYEVAVGLQSEIARTLDALADLLERPFDPQLGKQRIREMLSLELARGAGDDRFPLSPARIVADTRAALSRDDIVLVDTGALKMWMARLYPTYEPNTCLISNGLSTMAWTVPGAIGAKLARPESRVLVATGDGAFMMNSQEIETEYAESGACVNLRKGPVDRELARTASAAARVEGVAVMGATVSRSSQPPASPPCRRFSPDAGPVSPGRRSSNAEPSSDNRGGWDHATRSPNSCIKSSYPDGRRFLLIQRGQVGRKQGGLVVGPRI